MLQDGGNHHSELVKRLARIDIGSDCTELQNTSSHSAPAVKRAIIVCEIPMRRPTITVWSMNLSAP